MKNDLSRRKLLGTAALAAFAGRDAWAGHAAAFGTKKIIVVGAGMAGITAAARLMAKGYDVLVLEGRSRTGGRIVADTSLGAPIDAGASWIHMSRGNPITPLARKYKVRGTPTNYDNYTLFDLNGGVIDEKRISGYDALFSSIMNDVLSQRKGLDHDISVADGFARAQTHLNLSADQTNAIAWEIASNVVGEYGTELKNMSLKSFFTDGNFAGPDLFMNGSYGQIVDGMARGLDIRTNQTVLKIDYSNGVSVTTNQGVFNADACIVTLPLGVLKSGTVTFNPPLPADKLAAINNLGMGTLNKLVLQFDTVFWPKGVEFFEHFTSEFNALPEWMNLDFYSQIPALLALTGGDFATALETMPDAAVKDVGMMALKSMFGSAIPNPNKILYTRWNSDPFSFGSYSYNALGTTLDDNDTLAQPVNDILFFAGEATHDNHPSTVHGAYESGKREAARVARLIR